jgi:hypothetical protein
VISLLRTKRDPYSGSWSDNRFCVHAAWLQTADDLSVALRQAAARARDAITEVKPYDLLAQNNEESALTIAVDETHADLLLEAMPDPTQPRKARHVRDLGNSGLYAVRFVTDAGNLIGVKRTDSSWRTKTSASVLNVFYDDDILALDTRPHFGLSSDFDFFIVGDQILILNKNAFESILNYKAGHIEDFSALQNEAEFIGLFAEMAPLTEYVAENKLRLRRMSAIRTKGHYKDPIYMGRLREQAANMGLSIAFDPLGRIAPTLESCADIIRGLLDLRLDSRLSQKLFDVESATDVPAPAPP